MTNPAKPVNQKMNIKPNPDKPKPKIFATKAPRLGKRKKYITFCKSFRMASIRLYKCPNTVWNSYPE